MASRAIEIVISAKNAMARGLSSAGKALKSFGGSVASITRQMTRAFAAVAAALTGVGFAALRAYKEQQQAETDMRSALRAHGDEVDKNAKAIFAYAAEIQNETGIADENTIARAARLRMLGVEVRHLKAASKAVIALAAAGMGEEQATRAVAAARNGDFQALQRYIPALRTATDDADKARIVTEFLNRGYQQQRDRLHTVAGAWGAFRGRVGDALEEIGRMISETGWVQSALQKAGDAAQRFGARIREFVDSERFAVMRREIEGLVKALASGGAIRGEAITAIMEVVKASFVVAAERAVDVFRKYAPKIGRLIGQHAAIAWEVFRPRATKDEATLQAEQEIEVRYVRRGAFGNVVKEGTEERFGEPNKLGFALERKEFREAVKRRAAEIRHEKIMQNMGLETADVTKEKSAAEIELATAIQKLRIIAQQANSENLDHADAHVKAWEDAAEKAKTAREFAQLEVQMKAASLARRERQLIEELEKRKTQAVKKGVQERIKIEQDKLAKMREIANKTVAMLLDERQQERDIQRERKRDERKAARLEEKIARGTKISKRDAEFLDAFREIQRNRDGLTEQEATVEKLQQQLDALEEANKTLDDMRSELNTIRAHLGAEPLPEIDVPAVDMPDIAGQVDRATGDLVSMYRESLRSGKDMPLAAQQLEQGNKQLQALHDNGQRLDALRSELEQIRDRLARVQ